MHPIHYSLILNLAALVVTGLLAWQFDEPSLVIVALLMAQHALAKFSEDDDEDEPGGPDEGEPSIGFTADIR